MRIRNKSAMQKIILIVFSLSACVASVTNAGIVFGVEYDQAWVVRYKFVDANNPQQIALFDKEGNPRRGIIDCSAPITKKDLLDRSDHLFSNLESFKGSGDGESGYFADCLVFYKNNKMVCTIIPNHVTMDLYIEKKKGDYDSMKISLKNLKKYQGVISDCLLVALQDNDGREESILKAFPILPKSKEAEIIKN